MIGWVYYKSVHAAKNTPGKVMVGIYLGEVVDSDLVSDGRWCAAVPGYYKFKSLDSKITDDWPWEKYIAEKAVGGFFNSSRKTPKSKSNLKDSGGARAPARPPARPPARLEQT